MTHALVVGGTGMLRGVTAALARRGHTVSVVARDPDRLRRLAADAGPGIVAVPVDYRDEDAFTRALTGATETHGPFDVAVVWIHSVAPEGPWAVALACARRAGTCRYVHVLGSAAADPAAPDPGRRERFEALPGLRYREVILGFVSEAGGSRWLTNDEISDGVLRAVDGHAARSVVGTVTPWSARP